MAAPVLLKFWAPHMRLENYRYWASGARNRGLLLGGVTLAFIGCFILLPPTRLESAETAPASTEWVSLFNGKSLAGWDTWLASPGEGKPPLGLNNDPTRVFSVVTEDGQPAIRVSGEIYGAITTHQEFGNLHARLEFKWGPKKSAPRNSPWHYRDSGILYWCIGPHGAGSGSWMRSVECNIMERSTGQWWSVAGAFCDSEAVKLVLDDAPWVPYRGEGRGETCFVYQQGFPLVTVPSSDGITPSVDHEMPFGEWNVCEVFAWGNVCVHVLNGKLSLVLINPRYLEAGKEVLLGHGKIQLQSEAAELFYRNIQIRTLHGLPEQWLPRIPPYSRDETGFQPLLEDSPRSDWVQCGPGAFVLENGVATGTGGMGLWWYRRREFQNFVLRGEWLQEQDAADSGIFFRFPNPADDPWNAVRGGHELEIGDSHPQKAEETTGSFYPFQPPTGLPELKTGQWHPYELIAIGHSYSLRIGGRLVNTWTDPQKRSLSGYLGIQNYNDSKTVRHRNLRIKELP